MKIIEGMKQIKDMNTKAEDLRKKVAQYCADLDYETPTYPDQTAQVKEWIQAHSDLLREIEMRRLQIQRTNMATEVEIEINGRTVKKTIAAWIHRRRDLADAEREMWAGVGRKEQNMREGSMQTSTGEKKDVHIRRYYDPKKRDEWVDIFRSEPLKIDSTLEVVNAVTDLIEK